MNRPRIQDVRAYWELNPVSAAAVPHPLGSPEYFAYYDRLREKNESLGFSLRLHEYDRFSGKRVLDVGCGNGYVLSRYALAGATVCGVDLTNTAIALCRGRFRLLGLAGHFSVGSAEELPFEKNSFDCVCCMGVLHHTPDTERAVAEMFRVLRPGGRLIVMVYHRNSAIHRIKLPVIKIITGKTVAQLVNEVDGIGNPKGDVYSKSELLELLQQFKSLDIFAGLLPRWTVLPRLAPVVPRLLYHKVERKWGWFLYAKGVKP